MSIGWRSRVSYLLWRAGIRHVLPRDYINRVHVEENHEPLVDLRERASFHYDDALVRRPALVRATVADLLISADGALGDDVTFKLYDAYRSLEDQAASWLRRVAEIRDGNPDLATEEVERLARVRVAQADHGTGTGYGGHQTGGAVDLTLCDGEGHDLDLGGRIAVHDARTPTRAAGLTPEQRSNRDLLAGVLTGVGFANYPAEWWHYAYGDRLWAAYTRRSTCPYGLVSAPDTRG